MTVYEFGSFCGAFLITGLIRYAYINWCKKHKDSIDPVMPNLLSFVTIVLLFGIINTYKFGFMLALFVAVIRYFWAQLCWLCIDCFIEYKKKAQNMIKHILIISASIVCFCCIKVGVITYVSENIVPDIINKSILSCWAKSAEDFCKNSEYFPENYIKMLNTVNKINDLEYKEFKNSSYAFEQSCLRTAKQQYYNQQQYMSKEEICYDLDSVTIYDVQNSQQAALSMFPIKAIKGVAKEILRN